VLLDGPALDVLSLESLRLPGRRLGIIGRWWLELRWLEKVCERVSPKARVLPRLGRVVYSTCPLLFRSFLLKNGFKSLLVWTIIRAMVIVFLVENTIPLSFLIVASAPASTPDLPSPLPVGVLDRQPTKGST
jgi:hypothetical protein